jgi:Fe2+ transport system protein FeoA
LQEANANGRRKLPSNEANGDGVALLRVTMELTAYWDAHMNMYQARSHSVLKILLISGGWGVRRNLNQLGMHVGDEVSIIYRAPFGGPLVVENHGSRVAIGRRLAEKIGVELIR